MKNFIQADAPGGHSVRIKLNLELPEIAAEPLNRGNTGDSQQTVTHIELRKITQSHQVGCSWFGLKSELEYFIESSGEA
jgi:hypothetical protein